MKILIFGNIGSGKTTLAKAVLDIFPKFNYVAIDEFRRRFGDGGLDGEFEAVEQFLETIADEDADQVIECTGVGRVGSLAWGALHDYPGPVIVVILQVDPETCLARTKDRVWSATPYPWPNDDMTQVIPRIDELFTQPDIKPLWEKLANVTILELPHGTPKAHEEAVLIVGDRMRASNPSP